MTEVYTGSEIEIPLGMLAKREIAYLIREKQIIKNSLNANLKAAVYEMRLGSFAFRWEGEKRITIRLDDQKYRELILPPNSLTFVTTIEKFNLPNDIIARFNLKVDWVHCGLLLGTGPIVNPGFDKYLLIPIHNFSSREVQIGHGKKLIAVEFTKIPLPKGEEEAPYEQDAFEEDVERLVEPFSDAAKFVESSISKVLREYNEKIENNTKEISDSKAEREKWNKRFTWGGLASAFVGGIALASLLFTTWAVHSDTRQKILAAHEVLLTTSARLEKENEELRNELLILNKQVSALSVSGILSKGKTQNSQVQLPTDVLNTTPQVDKKAQTSPPLIGATSTHHNEHAY